MQLCIDLSLVPGVQWYMVSYQSPLKMLEFMAWPILTVRNTWVAIFAAVVDGNVCPVERRISPVLHVSSLTTGAAQLSYPELCRQWCRDYTTACRPGHSRWPIKHLSRDPAAHIRPCSL